jgi:membrane-bound lytic murein transglycosylase B
VLDGRIRRISASGFAALLVSVGAAATAAAPAAPSPAPQSAAASPSPQATIVPAAEDARIGTLAHKLYEQARAGTIDHSLLEPAVAQAVTPAVEAALAAQFGALPTPTWRYLGQREGRGGVAHYYLLTYPQNALRMVLAVDKDGLVSTLLFQPAPSPSSSPAP